MSSYVGWPLSHSLQECSMVVSDQFKLKFLALQKMMKLFTDQAITGASNSMSTHGFYCGCSLLLMISCIVASKILSMF